MCVCGGGGGLLWWLEFYRKAAKLPLAHDVTNFSKQSPKVSPVSRLLPALHLVPQSSYDAALQDIRYDVRSWALFLKCPLSFASVQQKWNVNVLPVRSLSYKGQRGITDGHGRTRGQWKWVTRKIFPTTFSDCECLIFPVNGLLLVLGDTISFSSSSFFLFSFFFFSFFSFSSFLSIDFSFQTLVGALVLSFDFFVSTHGVARWSLLRDMEGQLQREGRWWRSRGWWGWGGATLSPWEWLRCHYSQAFCVYAHCVRSLRSQRFFSSFLNPSHGC